MLENLNHHTSSLSSAKKMHQDIPLTSNMPLRFDILVKIWLYEAEPLLDAAFDVSSTLTDISKDLLTA